MTNKADAFKDFEKIDFKGKAYYVLEPISEVLFETDDDYTSLFDESGWELGVAHAVAADAEPNAEGFYPCVDLSFVRKDHGDWTPDEEELMTMGDEAGHVFRLYWDATKKCYQLGEQLAEVS